MMTPLAEKLMAEVGTLAAPKPRRTSAGGGGFRPPEPPEPPEPPDGDGPGDNPWDEWGFGWDTNSFDPQALLDEFEKRYDQEASYYNRCPLGEYVEEMKHLFLGVTDKPKAAVWIINTSDRIPPKRKATVMKGVVASLEFQLDIARREKEVPVEEPCLAGDIRVGDKVRYVRLSQQVRERDTPLLGREGVVSTINDGSHPSVGHSGPEKTCYWVAFYGLEGLRPVHRSCLCPV